MKRAIKHLLYTPMLIVFIFILIFFAPFAIFQPGENKTRAIITAIGIDKIDNQYELSLLTFIPTPNQTYLETNSVVSGKGPSIAEAIADAELTLGRKIGLSHAKTTVVNEAMLDEDVAKDIDYLGRVASLAENTIFVCTDNSARELLMAAQTLQDNVGLKLEQLINYNASKIYVTDTSLEAFYKGYFSDVGASIIGFFTLGEGNSVGQGGSEGSGNSAGAEGSSGSGQSGSGGGEASGMSSGGKGSQQGSSGGNVNAPSESSSQLSSSGSGGGSETNSSAGKTFGGSGGSGSSGGPAGGETGSASDFFGLGDPTAGGADSATGGTGSSSGDKSDSSTGGESPTTSNSGSGGQKQIMNKGETILLKKGKRVARLNHEQLNGINILNQKAVFQTLLLRDVTDDLYHHADLTFIIRNKRVQISTKFQNGHPVFSANIVAGLELMEIREDGKSLKLNTEFSRISDIVAARIEQKLRKDFADTLKILREHKTDVIGVTETFERNNRKEFRAFMERLDNSDEFLDYINFQLAVRVQSD